MKEREPQCRWERREGSRECGNKDREKKDGDGEGELCATINHLLGVQVYLASFFYNTQGGGCRKRYTGVRREAVREEQRRGQRSLEIQRKREEIQAREK